MIKVVLVYVKVMVWGEFINFFVKLELWYVRKCDYIVVVFGFVECG